MNSDQNNILLNILPIKRDDTATDETEIYTRLAFNNAFGTEVSAILHFMGLLPDSETDQLNDADSIDAAIATINDCINAFQAPGIRQLHIDFMNNKITQREYTRQINALKLSVPKAHAIVGAFFISAVQFYSVLHKTFEDQVYDKDPMHAYINTNNALAAQKRTYKIFERFDRVQPGMRAAIETAKKKAAIKQLVWDIIKQHNLGRPSARNPIKQMCTTIKQIFQEQTGTPYPNTDKTLENHIYDCPVFPR